MKKVILILSFLYIFTPSAFSTHFMGGEIIAQHDGGNNYIILLTLYRDTAGIPMQTSQLIDIRNSNGNLISSNLKSCPGICIGVGSFVAGFPGFLFKK